VIQSIINELKGSKELLEHYDPSGQLHYALISSGSYRTYQKGRINIVIFNEDGNPLFFLKFYKDKQTNPLMEAEFEKLKFLCSQYKNLKISKPLALLKIHDFSIMVIEAFNGKTLSRLLSENPSIENVIDAIEYGKKVQADLNDTLLVSHFSAFEHEVDDLVHAFTSLYKPTPFVESLIKKYTDIFKYEFKDKPVYKRVTNGDFVPKNIILSGDRLPVLIDFEFMEETHLYFLDWFRFFTYYFNVPLEIIHHILEHDFDDYFLNAALFKFRDPKELVNDPTIGALWLVFYLKDFIIKSSVMPDQQLKNEREHLRSTLSSLLTSVFTQDHEIMELIRDEQIKDLESGLQQREQQISELTGAVQGKEEQIQYLKEQIADISSQLKGKDVLINELNVAICDKAEAIRRLESEVDDRDKHINELNVAICDKTEGIRRLESELEARDKHINELNVAVCDKTEGIRRLESEVEARDKHINELNVAICDKAEGIRRLESEVEARDKHINELNVAICDKAEGIRRLESEVEARDKHINELNVAVCDKAEAIKKLEWEINNMSQLRCVRLHRKIEAVFKKVRLRGQKEN
jgi:peptidoglycan hydrolase CwlO-like protein